MSSKASKNITYREFVSKELRRLRDKHPDLANTDYMKLAAKQWKKYKLQHGIKTAAVGVVKKVVRKAVSGSKSAKKSKSKTYKPKSKTSKSKSKSKTTKSKSKTTKSKSKSKSKSKAKAK